MKKIIWALKQLLPLRYKSKYSYLSNGEIKGNTVFFNMWFGKCFNIKYIFGNDFQEVIK
jgi:hypothetical protein